MVSRRRVLQLAGSTATAGGLASGVVGAGRGDEKRSGQRPTTRVVPFADQQVPVGRAIEHSIGWVENCGSEAERLARLEAFLEVVELDVHIEGVEVGDPAQHWGEPYVDGDDVYVWWRLETDPRPPGVYEFDLTLRFTEPYGSKYASDGGDCETTVREGVIFEGDTVYEVTQTAGAGKSGDAGEG